MGLEESLDKALKSLVKALPDIAKEFEKLDNFSQTFTDNIQKADETLRDNSFRNAFSDQKKNIGGVVKALGTQLKFSKDIAKSYSETNRHLRIEKKTLNDKLKQSDKLEKLGTARTAEQTKLLAKLKAETDERTAAMVLMKQSNELLNKGWLGVFRKVGAVANAMQPIFDIASELGKVIGPLIGKAFDFIFSLAKKTFDKFLEIQKATGAISSDMNLTTTQMEQMRRQVAAAAIDATQLMVTMEEVAKIQSSLAEATGRNVLLSKNQILNIAEIGKGTSLGLDAASELAAVYDLMGNSVEELHGYMNQTVKDLQKSGLNGQKVLGYFTKMYAESALISGSFKVMEKGMMNIAKLSAKYRADLTGISQLSDQIFNPEGAIELAAKLRVLGGGFANLADPFQLMYQGQNDIEGLTKSIIEATQASARWNYVTKQFEIPPKQRGILKEVAESVGISADELAKMAIQGAKFNKITAQIGINAKNIGPELGEYIQNIAELDEKGNAFIKIKKGLTDTSIFLKDIGASNMQQIENQLKQTQSLTQMAQNRMTVMDRIRAIGDKFFTMTGEKILNLLESTSFKNLFQKLMDTANYLIDNLGTYLDNILSPGSKLMTGINKFFEQTEVIVDKLMTAFSQDGLKGLGNELINVIKNMIWPSVLELLSKSVQFLKENMGDPVKKKINKAGIWGGAGAGALLGLKAGAALGSIVPGIGNIAGAIGGTIIGGIGGAIAGNSLTKFDDGRINDPKSAMVQTGSGSVNVQKFAKGDALYAINEKAIGNSDTKSAATYNNFNMPGVITIRVEGDKTHTITRDEIIKVLAANYQEVANKSTKIAETESNTSQQGKRNPKVPVTPLT